MERFGEKLRTLRESHNLSIRQLAAELDIRSHSHIVNLEANRKKPSLELILKICDLFAVTPNQLLLDDVEVMDQ
jgi:transcriptional regulator with XRE-family HTH domain